MSDPFKTWRNKQTYSGYYNQPTPQSLSIEDYSQMDYTAEDLVKDQFYLPIEEYMVSRFGTHMKDKNREDVVEQYLNNRRGVAGGNSVRSLSELAYLSGLEDDEMQVAGKAYAIYENLPGLFDERSSWSNTLGGMWDFTRSAVLDPVNLLGGLIGKTVTSGGFKGTSIAANIGARKAYEASIQKSVAKGLTQELAQAQATKVAQRILKGASNTIIAKQAEKAAWRNTVVGGVKNQTLAKVATKGNLVEAGTYAFIDGAAAGATDWAYQTGLYQTGVIDSRSAVQSGSVALASGVLSGALAAVGGTLTKRGGQSIAGPDVKDILDFRKGAKIGGIGKGMAAGAAQAPDAVKRTHYGKWIDDVQAGKELNDLDLSFWNTLLLGNDDAGIRGLSHIMEDQNLRHIPIDDNDNFTNFLGDIVKYAPKEEYDEFITALDDITPVDIKSISQTDFANTFKRKISDLMRTGGTVGKLAQKYGIEENAITGKDIFSDFVDDGTGNWTKAIEKNVHPFISKTVPQTQNQIIRLMVANLATTQLNLLGWSVASALDTATDLVSASLQLPLALVGKKNATKNFYLAARNSFTKLQNTLDPNTTKDEFVKYLTARPKALQELNSIISGGVENADKVYKELNLDIPIWSMRADQAVDFIQDTQLVRAQDAYTKSIEFMSALDKGIRKEYGMSYHDFMKQDRYWEKMFTPEYQQIERRAVTTALDNIFGRSYGKMPGTLGEVADIIEKARNIPLVGVYMPFGRFFNNTIAFMSDYGGLSLAMKVAGLNTKSTESLGSLASRAAVGWSIMFTLAQRESSFIDMGLAWDEQTGIGDVSGAITSEKYNFPYAFLKAGARMIAYKARGMEVPEEMVYDIGRTLGPEAFTREFTEAFGEGGETMLQIIQGDEGAASIITSIFGKMAGQAASSSTRFLEPLNSAIGIVQGQDRVMQDRRQGNTTLNNAMRYMDNVIQLVNDPRYSATRGKQRPQDTKFLAPVREVKTTNMSRLASMVGVAEWDANITMIGSQAPEASNKYAKYYNQINEKAAEALLNSSKFKKSDLETKRVMFSELLSRNKEMIKDYMEADIFGGDAFLIQTAKIKKEYKDDTIKKVMNELSLGDKELMDLTPEELHLLESALSVRKDVLTFRP